MLVCFARFLTLRHPACSRSPRNACIHLLVQAVESAKLSLMNSSTSARYKSGNETKVTEVGNKLADQDRTVVALAYDYVE